MRTAFPKFIFNNIKKDKKIFVLLGDIGVYSFKDTFAKYKKNITTNQTNSVIERYGE